MRVPLIISIGRVSIAIICNYLYDLMCVMYNNASLGGPSWCVHGHMWWPGKVHDARVFSNSTLYQRGQAGTLLPAWTRQIGLIQVPLCILGDPAYPALTWLMKAYPEQQNMTVRQINYNYRLSRARMVVENAFGRLKGRWRCLLK